MKKFHFWMGIHCGENKGFSMWSHVVFVNFNHQTLNFGKIIGDRYKLWASNVLIKFMTYVLIIICIILIWFSNSNNDIYFINWLKTTFGCTYVEATYILSNSSKHMGCCWLTYHIKKTFQYIFQNDVFIVIMR
jgi:hypothetical protein